MIARAASSPPSAPSSGTAASTPASSRSIGSRSPISPVEQTATSPRRDAERHAPTRSAVAWVSWKPAGPVQALAPPELRTTASTRPSAHAPAAVQSTGAALTRLRGEDAGGGLRRPVVDDERDVEHAAGLQPGGDAGGPEARRRGDAHGVRHRRPIAVRPAVSARPSDEVGVLDRLAGGALDEVVERGDDDGAAAVRVDGDLQVHAVGAGRRGGGRPLALGQHVHERLVVVRRVQRVAQLRRRSRPGAAGRCRSRGCRAASARASA